MMSQSTRRVVTVLSLSSCLIALLAIGFTTAAFAHAGVVSTTPEDGDTLDAVPEQVVLSFNEEMNRPSFVSVTAPDGTLLAEGEAEVDGRDLVQPFDDPDQAGPYLVNYRAVSADGHPITGDFTFEVSEGAAVEPATENVDAQAQTESDNDRSITPIVIALVAVPALAAVLLWLRRRSATD